MSTQVERSVVSGRSDNGSCSDDLCAVPVVMFVFNRPEATREVLQSVAMAAPRKLLVIADGPRSEMPGDVEKCRQVRDLFRDLPWSCALETNYSDTNLGCRTRVSSGLDWVFLRYESAIILEDDTVPTPGFFRFCEILLERFRYDPRVHMIRGWGQHQDLLDQPNSYYFSRWTTIWGWATWARAWKHYDVSMSDWGRLRKSRWLEKRLPALDMARIWRDRFDVTYQGGPDWDVQWFFSALQRDALTIVPEVNLVKNIGFGPSATHTANADAAAASRGVNPIQFPLDHPADIRVNQTADEIEWKNSFPGLRSKLGVLRRATDVVRRASLCFTRRR